MITVTIFEAIIGLSVLSAIPHNKYTVRAMIAGFFLTRSAGNLMQLLGLVPA